MIFRVLSLLISVAMGVTAMEPLAPFAANSQPVWQAGTPTSINIDFDGLGSFCRVGHRFKRPVVVQYSAGA